MILYLTYINFSNGDSTCIKLSFLFFQDMNCYQNKTLVFFISAAGMAYFLVMNLFGGDAEPKTSSLPRSEATGLEGSSKEDTAKIRKLSFCNNTKWKTKEVLKNIIILKNS